MAWRSLRDEQLNRRRVPRYREVVIGGLDPVNVEACETRLKRLGVGRNSDTPGGQYRRDRVADIRDDGCIRQKVEGAVALRERPAEGLLAPNYSLKRTAATACGILTLHAAAAV